MNTTTYLNKRILLFKCQDQLQQLMGASKISLQEVERIVVNKKELLKWTEELGLLKREKENQKLPIDTKVI